MWRDDALFSALHAGQSSFLPRQTVGYRLPFTKIRCTQTSSGLGSRSRTSALCPSSRLNHEMFLPPPLELPPDTQALGLNCSLIVPPYAVRSSASTSSSNFFVEFMYSWQRDTSPS